MKLSLRSIAVLQALLVTLLWSVSTIVAANEVTHAPALLLAGLSCAVAFLTMLPVAVYDVRRTGFMRLVPWDAWRLVALGVLQYVFATGGQFLGLQYLPATTVRLLFALTPVFVAGSGIFLLNERPSKRQWGGLSLCVVGVFLYFSPLQVRSMYFLGLAFGLLGVLGATGGNLLARSLNRERRLSPAVVTTVSLGVGAALLLGLGATGHGVWTMSGRTWAAIVWLGVVNTALATLLLNVSLRTLSALEVSVVLNTTLVQVAVLAWVFLGQPLLPLKVAGLLVVIGGAVVVQRWPREATEASAAIATQEAPEGLLERPFRR